MGEGGSVEGWARGTVGVVGRGAIGTAAPATAVAEGGGKEEEEWGGKGGVVMEAGRRGRAATDVVGSTSTEGEVMDI